MEFIIELIMELFIEGSFELLPNKKIPKWIRYILGIILILFFGAIILGIIIAGFINIKNEPIGASVIMLIGIVLLVFALKKFLEVKAKMK